MSLAFKPFPAPGRREPEFRSLKPGTHLNGRWGRFELIWFGLLAGILSVSGLHGLAETVRVANWSFPQATSPPTAVEANLKEAAAALKALNPDVILVQGSRDWAMCSALAKALEPADYTVLVCSAFPKQAGASAGPGQVAILSKRKGYFSWAEAWRVEGAPEPPGGFAFAAVQFGKERVGFFSTRTESEAAAQNALSGAQGPLGRQWAQTLATFRAWVTNRLDAVVVATGEPTQAASGADTTLQFLSAPLGEAVRVPEPGAETKAAAGLTRVELARDPGSLPGVLLNGLQPGCELVLTAAKPKPAVPAQPKLAVETAPPAGTTQPSGKDAFHRVPISAEREGREGTRPYPPAATALNSPLSPLNRTALYVGAVAGAALVLLVWVWNRRRSVRARVARLFAGPAQLTNGVSSFTLVVNPPSLGSEGASAGAGSPLPHLAPPGQASGNEPGPVQAWTSGPVLLEPSPRAEASDRAGLLLHLSQWLKQKLVQRLMADRAGLMKTQQAATVKLVSFEERLGRIERQLQEQNQAYERRIEELNEELLAAREENRELIRARIAQVKAEMQSARARLLAQAGLDRRGQND